MPTRSPCLTAPSIRPVFEDKNKTRRPEPAGGLILKADPANETG